MTHMADPKIALLRALWRDKIHVAPRALELSAPRVRNAFEHILAPADAVIDLVRPLPAGMLDYWLRAERGHVVVQHTASRYEPRSYAWRTGDLASVALVSAVDLVDARAAGRDPILRMLDHLLGSDGQGACLSDGAGADDALADVAQRFVRIHELGYGHDQLGVRSAGDYLVATWALYIDAPRELMVMDPLVFRLFRDRLMNPRSWAALL